MTARAVRGFVYQCLGAAMALAFWYFLLRWMGWP